VTGFLSNPAERNRLSQSMLKPVLERFTYEKTSSRLLAMIAEDQARVAQQSTSGGVATSLAA
jgi:spore maturation protein CgeB